MTLVKDCSQQHDKLDSGLGGFADKQHVITANKHFAKFFRLSLSISKHLLVTQVKLEVHILVDGNESTFVLGTVPLETDNNQLPHKGLDEHMGVNSLDVSH